MLSRAKN